MSETIRAITEHQAKGGGGYGTEAGYKIITTDQEIVLAIDDDRDCCESWGYFLSEDDLERFVGAELYGVTVTDTNLTSRTFYDYLENEDLDSGNTLFVNIETSEGVLQFVAYNAHNGYYGHEARVTSKQLTHKACL